MADSGVKLPPFRSLHDFCLDFGRFRLPATKDDSRWTNRVVNNLLYYQTNYFAVLFLWILFIGLIYPAQFLFGSIGTLAVGLASVLSISKHHSLAALRQKHLIAFVLALGFLAFIVLTNIRSIAIFSFPFAFSLLLILLHASTRTRNIQNRVANASEQLGIQKSPMGVLMDIVGYEVRMRTVNPSDAM